MRKEMKRSIAVLCTLALTFASSVVVLAEDTKIDQDSSPKEAKVTVSTTITPTYTVTIPESTNVTFEKTENPFGTIKLSGVKLEPECYVQVTVDSDGALKHADAPEKVIPYTICDSEGAPFQEAGYNAEGDETTLTIHIEEEAWNAAYGGSYSDIVTFTVAYVNPNA